MNGLNLWELGAPYGGKAEENLTTVFHILPRLKSCLDSIE
jgi:hypothetical protein